MLRIHVNLPRLPLAASLRVERLEKAAAAELAALLSVDVDRISVACGPTELVPTPPNDPTGGCVARRQ